MEHDAVMAINRSSVLVAYPLAIGGRGNAFRYTLKVHPVIPFTLNDDWNLITRTVIASAHVEGVFPRSETGIRDIV